MKVKTMRGNALDMGQLIARNEKAIALGNGSMNARGDIVNAQGAVVKRREQVTQEYYNSNPKAVKQVALRDISKEVFQSPAEALANLTAPPVAKVAPAAAPKAEEKLPAVEPTTQRKRKIEDRDD